MKTKTKALALACCAVLLVATTVFVTVAYLTSQDTVTNTFTVGKIAITLDEAKVDTNGKEITGEGAERVKENGYKLMPGHEYTKDPTVHIDENSEDCWVFVKVENGIADIEDGSIATQLASNEWTPISEDSDIYVRQRIANAKDNLKVFETFKIKGAVTNDTLATYADKTIKVTAYAVQADGFENALDAWNATFGAE